MATELKKAGPWKPRILAALTVAGALVMTVLPIPGWALPFWPEWSILVVIYWCLALPHRLNLAFAWTTGLLVDLIKGTLLGQCALAYLLVAYICISIHQRLRIYPLFQQAFAVGVLLVPYFLVLLWIDGGLRPTITVDWRYWMPIVSSMLLWPWIFSMLRLARRKAL